MLKMKNIELTADKQSKFWAAPLDHYKALLTAKPLFEITRSYIGRRVLDVGAADGSLMRYIREHAPFATEVTGIDLAPKNPEVIKGNCTSLPFDDASFDTVFLTDVAEHLATDDLALCMRETARVLKPGGNAVFATPNDEQLSANVILCPHCEGEFHRWGHCQSFTADSLGSLVTRYGFMVLTTKTLNLGLLAKRPIVAGWIYKLKLSKIYKAKTFHHDLILIARKE
jgi:2-polyprenyl-3-methyl-5-hydroxy-6-metoxy-1,4-benzoquinol methylase